MVEQLYKDSEVGLIPNDWELKTVEPGIGKVKSGKRLPKGYSLVSIPNSHPYIRVSDMCEGGINLSGIMYVPDDIYPCIENYRISIEDVFISVAGTLGVIGKIPYLLNGANLTENANKITDLSIDRDFLMYWLSGSYIQSKINDCKTIGAQPKLALYNIRNFPVPVPSIHEQRRIAQALSDTDDLISSMEKLIAKKQNIKKAMMQELLTGERYHTKEGKISDFNIEVKKGTSITKHSISEGDIPVVAGGKEPAYYCADYNREGDTITISASGASAGYVEIYSGKIFASDCSTISESMHFSLKYLYYLLKLYQNKIYEMQTGGAQPHIHPKDIMKLKVVYVNNIDDQKSIANVLTNSDNEIAKLTLKMIKLKHLKQAMMQELLTGHIRLLEQRG